MAKLGWTDKAAAEIAAAKAEAIGGGSNPGGNSQGGNDSGDGPTNEPLSSPCTLGAGPKVKSLATVLWRQTRGLRLPLWAPDPRAAP